MITKKITIFTKIKQNKNGKEKRKKEKRKKIFPCIRCKRVWSLTKKRCGCGIVGSTSTLKKKKKKKGNDFSQFPPVS
jgi:hypothetical protein